MEMPVVTECAVEDCAYNRDHACHALAITVGYQQTEVDSLTYAPA